MTRWVAGPSSYVDVQLCTHADIETTNKYCFPWGKAMTATCSAANCARPQYARGFCTLHWKRPNKTGDAQERIPVRTAVRGRVGCLVDGCDRPHRSIGLCAKHSSAAHSYSLSAERYAEMLRQPCAICGRFGEMCIDHDHTCCPGKRSCGRCIRGVLCMPHNRMLGQLKDDLALLIAAAAYLEAWAARSAS